MIPRPIPTLTEKQWAYLMKEMERGPRPKMQAILKRAKETYETLEHNSHKNLEVAGGGSRDGT